MNTFPQSIVRATTLMLCTSSLLLCNINSLAQEDDNEIPNNQKYYYDFHPLSTLTLGGTFDPNHLDEGKISPFKVLDTVRYEGPGSIQTNFELHLVNSKQQMSSVLQFDAKTDVRYFKVEASARFGFMNSYNFSQNDINLVISARSEYSRRGFSEFEFTPEALELMDDPKRFRKVYGSRVVTMERLGSSVFVVVKISNVSSSMRNKIYAGFDMSAKFGPVKVNVSTSLKKETAKAASENRVDLTVVSTADPDGVPGLAAFVANLEATGYDFDRLMKAISDYMKTIKPEYEKPIGYFTTSINNLGLPKPRIEDVLFSQKLETAMAKVADSYRTAQSEIDLAKDLLNGVHPAHVYLNAAWRERLLSSLDTLRSRQDQLVDIQEKFVKKYDGLDSPRRVRKIDEERGFRTWNKFFFIPSVPRQATQFMEQNAGIKLCMEGDNVLLTSKGIESVQLMVNWVGASDEEAKREILPTSWLFATPPRAVDYANPAPGGASQPIEAVWGGMDQLLLDKTKLLNYFRTTNVTSGIIAGTGQQRPAEPKYMVDVVVKNALGYQASFPLGVFYFDHNAPVRRDFFLNQQACQVLW